MKDPALKSCKKVPPPETLRPSRDPTSTLLNVRSTSEPRPRRSFLLGVRSRESTQPRHELQQGYRSGSGRGLPVPRERKQGRSHDVVLSYILITSHQLILMYSHVRNKRLKKIQHTHTHAHYSLFLWRTVAIPQGSNPPPPRSPATRGTSRDRRDESRIRRLLRHVFLDHLSLLDDLHGKDFARP